MSFCCAALLLYGCGTANPFGTVPVTGTVTLDGAPLDGVTISFRPSDDGMTAVGMTDVNGNFVLTTPGAPFGTGAVPGSFTVSFSKLEPVPVTPMGSSDTGGGMRTPVSLIPTRYNNPQTTGFDPIEVVARGRNHFEFNLESQ